MTGAYVLLRRLEGKYNDVFVLLYIIASFHATDNLTRNILLFLAFLHFARALLERYGKSPLRVCDICFKNVVAVNEAAKNENKD